jgi:FtsH-binding integral membrane protein
MSAETYDVGIDVGLRNHMATVYGLLAKGLAVSAISAVVVYYTAFGLFFQEDGLTTLGWIAMLAPLGILLLQMFRVIPHTLAASRNVFWAFVTLKGVWFAMLGVAFAPGAIFQAFAITAAAFAGLSYYAHTTKRDLNSWFPFLFIGLIGLILGGIVNMFVGSGAIGFALTAMSLIVFGGLIAWENQAVRNAYHTARNSEELALIQYDAALGIYISVVAFMRSVLSLIGNR